MVTPDQHREHEIALTEHDQQTWNSLRDMWTEQAADYQALADKAQSTSTAAQHAAGEAAAGAAEAAERIERLRRGDNVPEQQAGRFRENIARSRLDTSRVTILRHPGRTAQGGAANDQRRRLEGIGASRTRNRPALAARTPGLTAAASPRNCVGQRSEIKPSAHARSEAGPKKPAPLRGRFTNRPAPTRAQARQAGRPRYRCPAIRPRRRFGAWPISRGAPAAAEPGAAAVARSISSAT